MNQIAFSTLDCGCVIYHDGRGRAWCPSCSAPPAPPPTIKLTRTGNDHHCEWFHTRPDDATWRRFVDDCDEQTARGILRQWLDSCGRKDWTITLVDPPADVLSSRPSQKWTGAFGKTEITLAPSTRRSLSLDIKNCPHCGVGHASMTGHVNGDLVTVFCTALARPITVKLQILNHSLLS